MTDRFAEHRADHCHRERPTDYYRRVYPTKMVSEPTNTGPRKPHHALTVVLETDVRSDDAEHMINAIRQIRGVLSVEPHVLSGRSEP